MTVFWVSLGASLALTGLAVPLLRRPRFLDVPNHRSSHDVPTPRGGGVACLVAVVLGCLVAAEPDAWPALVPAVLLGAVGLVDDLRSLSSRIRLGAQLVAAAVVAAWLAGTAGTAGVGPVAFAGLVVLGVVGYVNAFNFMDGVNGISALNAAVAGGWFAWLGHEFHLPVLVALGAAGAGAALGFLPWNAGSRVFLGDVGSYGLGALIAGTAAVAWAHEVPGPMAIAPLLVYLADTGWVIVRRARAGKPLAEPHREHTYQRLVQQGWPHLAASSWSAGLAALVAFAMAWLFPEHPALALVVASVLLGVYLSSARLVEARRSRAVVAP